MPLSALFVRQSDSHCVKRLVCRSRRLRIRQSPALDAKQPRLGLTLDVDNAFVDVEKGGLRCSAPSAQFVDLRLETLQQR